jgi:glycosyltransferase involved in cell wall biosynthesis
LKPKRILHVTPYAPLAWAYGGIPRVVGALAREQARRGHRVTVCATDAKTASDRYPSVTGASRWLPQTAVIDSDGVELKLFPNLSNRLAYDWQAFIPVGLSAYLSAHAHEFDVAHLHACRNVPGVIAARHLRRAGVPYVLAPNGTAPRLERRFAAKRLFDLVSGRRVLANAAAIIAVSDAERRQLTALGIPASRVRLVPNPVALDEFSPGPVAGSFRVAHGLGSALIILFLGKLTPRKHVDILIRAFGTLDCPDARLVIAGNDMGSEPRARALVAELGLGPRTLFTGLLQGSARLQALADATVVVYPSSDEIFGLVPLEALLSGTPVIVSDDSGCGEVIGRVGGGLTTPPRDVEALGAAIRGILDSYERWLPEVARAKTRIHDYFSPKAVVDALDDVYTGMLARPATEPAGVSFVVPVRRGAPWLRTTLEAIWADQEGWPFEVIVVDDGVRGDGDDGSMAIARSVAHGRPLKIVPGPGRGASAAMNVGFRAARYPIVCQIDQDVTIGRGWTRKLVAALDDPRIAAAQGRYVIDPAARLGARVMATDLEHRYDALGTTTDHVCTGNAAYRADAAHAVGLFDEALGYGYDNDLSYRLRAAGHRLAFVREATSVHHWRDSFGAYLRQQYGFGYGRLDVVAKHPTRVGGDDVSGAAMMLHPVALAAGLTLLASAAVMALGRGPATEAALAGTTIIAVLLVERVVAGLVAWRRFGEPAALFFPLWHLARDMAWVSAMAVWTTRRAVGSAAQPSHSMKARMGSRLPVGDPRVELPNHPSAPTRIIGIIPAHNERTSLASVLGEIRTHHPQLDILVVDDGSTDGTHWLLEEFGVTYVRLPERMGVGSAMRAGLGYAAKLGYDAAVRLDGDGQHRPEDIDRLLAPLMEQRADVVIGSRYGAGLADGRHHVRLIQRVLAAWLSVATGSRVNDPTSGFCAIGPRAIRLLADHHPTGYPEPELHLLLNRNGLIALEVPVRSRARLGGRSSLTPFRLAGAAARVLLALVTVPFRRAVVFRSRD